MPKDIPRAIQAVDQVEASTLQVGDVVFTPTSRRAREITSLAKQPLAGGEIITISVGGDNPMDWSVPSTMKVRKVKT